MENTKTIAKARQGLRGTIEIPGDKSISHRSVMFSALGSTPVHITNFLHAQDCLSTAACMKALGASVEFESETSLVVCGTVCTASAKLPRSSMRATRARRCAS